VRRGRTRREVESTAETDNAHAAASNGRNAGMRWRSPRDWVLGEEKAVEESRGSGDGSVADSSAMTDPEPDHRLDVAVEHRDDAARVNLVVWDAAREPSKPPQAPPSHVATQTRLLRAQASCHPKRECMRQKFAACPRGKCPRGDTDCRHNGRRTAPACERLRRGACRHRAPVVWQALQVTPAHARASGACGKPTRCHDDPRKGSWRWGRWRWLKLSAECHDGRRGGGRKEGRAYTHSRACGGSGAARGDSRRRRQKREVGKGGSRGGYSRGGSDAELLWWRGALAGRDAGK